MKSILITGISGFVGGHFTDFLLKTKTDYVIHGVSQIKTIPGILYRTGIKVLVQLLFISVICSIQQKFMQVIGDIQPDYILHLASFSSVAQSLERTCCIFSQ